MSKEDIPELIHAATVLLMILGFLVIIIKGVDEGWL